MTTLTTSSTARIERFVRCFLGTEFYANYSASEREDFIGNADRAARCYDAAENGADGSTHSEAIDDMRHAFRAWMRDKRRGMWSDCERFAAAVEAHFDGVEAWHQQNGSLEREIG